MRSFGLLLVAILMMLATAPTTTAQVREDRTLLSWTQMNDIAQEASGERSMHNLLEQVPYQRVHPLSEYGDGHFQETTVVERLAKSYGFSDVGIETFAGGRGNDYQPTVGQLWMMGPRPRKLFDIYDTPVALASGSVNGDVTAELVDVGDGSRPEDYVGKDVAGKVVLGSGRSSSLQRLAVFERGAVGVLSYGAVYPITEIDAMMSQSVSAEGPDGQSGGFGWSITPRMGRELSMRLAGGEQITMRSVIEATSFPGELEVVHATIPGDGSSDQIIFVSGHLFEGMIKQGANDDNSGVAVTLEMGRAYIQLIKEGKLPPPKRTIHFLWIPEISGTNAYLNAHPDLEAAAIANFNFDMEGIRLSTAGAYWVLHRTPDSMPHYINDVSQSVMEFVSENNRERLRFRGDGYGFSWPVVSTNGSRDPFYTKTDKHYGSSDHVTFMQHGIPAIMWITWPDRWYHTSQDLPDKQDATQHKRVVTVGLAAMSVIAGADDRMALRIANESLGRGSERVGANHRKGLSYLADATNGDELVEAYKEAKNAVRHAARIEKEVLATVAELYTDQAAGARALAPLQALVDARSEQLVKEATASFKASAAQMGVSGEEPRVTDLERQAMNTVVQVVPREGGTGGFGGGRGGFGGGGNMSPEDRAAMAKMPSVAAGEFRQIMGRGMTVMEIRDFLAGEFDPIPLTDLMDYLKLQERQGAIKLVAK